MEIEDVAFYQIFKENTGIISKVCRIYTNTEEDFQDYFQEVTLQLWKSFKSFRGEAKPSTWIYRVALNVCLLQLRKKKRSPSIQPLAFMHSQVAATPYSSEADQQIERLYEAIKKLKESDRAIIFLYLEDKSYKEISELLGITVTNVGVKVNRLKIKLKEMLTVGVEE